MAEQDLNWEDVLATVQGGHIDWIKLFDERQRSEIGFDRLYAAQYAHGTDGHNARMIIARMAKLLDAICSYYEASDR